MTGSKILDVAIGLSFTYLLLSLICSSLNEIVAGLFGLRQKTLVRGIERMLGDSELLRKAVYGHPLVQSLHHGVLRSTKKPSYIPNHVFAAVLADVLGSPEKQLEAAKAEAAEQAKNEGKTLTEQEIDAVEDRVKAQLGYVQNCIRTLVEGTKVEERAARALEVIGRWFDDAMDRVSGAYKRASQIVLVVIGLVLAVALNVDTVTVARSLWVDPELRKSVAEEASRYAAAEVKKVADSTKAADEPGGQGRTNPPHDQTKDFSKAIDDANEKLASANATLDALRLPVGWRDGFWSLEKGETHLGKILGLAITVLAISLGAPFWFDALNRLANLRNAGGKPPTEAARAKS